MGHNPITEKNPAYTFRSGKFLNIIHVEQTDSGRLFPSFQVFTFYIVSDAKIILCTQHWLILSMPGTPNSEEVLLIIETVSVLTSSSKSSALSARVA